jgi:hypothetical protein
MTKVNAFQFGERTAGSGQDKKRTGRSASTPSRENRACWGPRPVPHDSGRPNESSFANRGRLRSKVSS